MSVEAPYETEPRECEQQLFCCCSRHQRQGKIMGRPKSYKLLHQVRAHEIAQISAPYFSVKPSLKRRIFSKASCVDRINPFRRGAIDRCRARDEWPSIRRADDGIQFKFLPARRTCGCKRAAAAAARRSATAATDGSGSGRLRDDDFRESGR